MPINGTFTIPLGYTTGGIITQNITTKSAQTYQPSITIQTISGGQYINEDQTITPVTGNATINDVVSGKIFSSGNGIDLIGQATIESLGGRRAVPGTSVSSTYNNNQQVINIASAVPFTPTVVCGTRYNSSLGRDAVTFCYYLLNGVYYYMIESALSDKVIFGSVGSTLFLSSLEVYSGSLANNTYNWIAIE
jgi:hypothetical protein